MREPFEDLHGLRVTNPFQDFDGPQVSKLRWGGLIHLAKQHFQSSARLQGRIGSQCLPEGCARQIAEAFQFPAVAFTFMTPAIMETTLPKLGKNWRMHWIEGADHSFKVQKSSGRTNAQVQEEVGDTVMDWVATL